MATTFPKEKKSKYYLILLLVIIFLLVIFFVVWRIFLAKPATVSPSIVLKRPEIKINFETLKSPILKELQPFEEIKPFEEDVGRENPFLPY